MQDSSRISTPKSPREPALPILRAVINIVGVLVILGGAIGLFMVMTSRQVGPGHQTPPRTLPKVRVITVQPQEVSLDFDGYGTVRAVRQFTLAPQVAGRVVAIHPDFEAGRFVKKDSVLVEIDPTDYQIALQQRKADLLQAEARIEEIRQNRKNLLSEIEVFRETMVMSHNEFKRTVEAWKDNPEAITVNVRDQTEAKYLRDKQALVLRESALALVDVNLKTAEAQRVAAASALNKAEVDLSRTKIRTPYDGRVLSRMVEQGQFVTTFPATGVGSVAALEAFEIPVIVEAEMLEHLPNLPSSRLPGQPAATEAESPAATVQWLAHRGKHRWDGKVVRIEPLDQTTRTIPLIVEVRDPWATGDAKRPPLPTGAYCKVRITGKKLDHALLVPERAVHEENKIYIARDGKLRIRSASVLHRLDGQVVVDQGLEPGDIVIVSPVAYPVEGMSIETLPLEAKAGDASP